MNSFAYLFRFCCDPLRDRKTNLDSIACFSKEMGADDVMVFCNVQELNTGHTTKEEQAVYIDLLKDIKAVLPKGVTMSVNQWHSVMHMDSGKSLKPGQQFRLMRDAKGREATLCVCPASKNWLNYIAELYAGYASLHPFCLWVEDDFRFHNHAPLEWGGCFCSEHMKRFSLEAGEKLNREDFIKAVLQPGPPHPWRKIWLDSCRKDLLNAASIIGQAVQSVSPESRLGLMSSLPQVHAAEGRDWGSLLKTLSRKNTPVLRIHLPAYSEMAPGAYMRAFNQISMLNRAMIPAETEVYPELENFPYSLYIKSRRFTRFQMLGALPLNLRGMTIDLFDLNGSGIVMGEGWQQMLAELHSILNRLIDTKVFFSKQLGVKVLVCQDSSYTLHTRCGKSMEELYPAETLFAALFGSFGISFSYAADIKSLRSGDVVAIGGQVLRNFDAETIESVFKEHFVLMDGDAADTLCDMGLGKLAGIASCRWIAQDNGKISYEEAEDGFKYNGIDKARASAMVSCCDVLDIRYDEESSVNMLSGFYGFERNRYCNGQAVVNNRVYIFPFGRRKRATEVPPMLLNSVRAQMLYRYIPLAESIPRTVLMPDVNLYAYEVPSGIALYLVNASTDNYDSLQIEIGKRKVALIYAIGSKEGPDKQKLNFYKDSEKIVADYKLNSMETVLLLLNCKD